MAYLMTIFLIVPALLVLAAWGNYKLTKVEGGAFMLYLMPGVPLLVGYIFLLAFVVETAAKTIN